FFFFTSPASLDISSLSLHDALPISVRHRDDLLLHHALRARQPVHHRARRPARGAAQPRASVQPRQTPPRPVRHPDEGLPEGRVRSEEHTSELQSLTNLVCRLLLEKK